MSNNSEEEDTTIKLQEVKWKEKILYQAWSPLMPETVVLDTSHVP